MKNVFITGSTRGLGLAMTNGFARAGWAVTGVGRSEKLIDGLRRALPGPDFRFGVLDVRDAAAVAKFADQVPTPDLLLNNAGRINASAPLWAVPVGEFSEVIDVNLKGVYHLIRAFVPKMIARGSGVIVNFSSGWGRSTSPEVAPYCCTKFGVEGLTAAMAQELPVGLAAVALNPGVINTEMLQSCFGGGAAGYPSPDEWAKTAVPFLAALGPADNGKALTAP